jgi:hypothetical protein
MGLGNSSIQVVAAAGQASQLSESKFGGTPCEIPPVTRTQGNVSRRREKRSCTARKYETEKQGPEELMRSKKQNEATDERFLLMKEERRAGEPKECVQINT